MFKKFALFYFFIFCGTSVSLETIEGEVISVEDGDSFTFVKPPGNEYKVKLIGIEAPELTQEYGESAKNILAKMILKKTVKVEIATRTVSGIINGWVTSEGIDINLKMINSGHAWNSELYWHAAPYMKQAQEMAKKERKGLWTAENPMPPWQFRSMRRTQKIEPAVKLELVPKSEISD